VVAANLMLETQRQRNPPLPGEEKGRGGDPRKLQRKEISYRRLLRKKKTYRIKRKCRDFNTGKGRDPEREKQGEEALRREYTLTGSGVRPILPNVEEQLLEECGDRS